MVKAWILQKGWQYELYRWSPGQEGFEVRAVSVGGRTRWGDKAKWRRRGLPESQSKRQRLRRFRTFCVDSNPRNDGEASPFGLCLPALQTPLWPPYVSNKRRVRSNYFNLYLPSLVSMLISSSTLIRNYNSNDESFEHFVAKAIDVSNAGRPHPLPTCPSRCLKIKH